MASPQPNGYPGLAWSLWDQQGVVFLRDLGKSPAWPLQGQSFPCLVMGSSREQEQMINPSPPDILSFLIPFSLLHNGTRGIPEAVCSFGLPKEEEGVNESAVNF